MVDRAMTACEWCGSPLRRGTRFCSRACASAAARVPVPDRIRSRLTIAANGCWLVPATTSSGYHHVNDRGRFLMAHRVMWEEVNGPVPDGLELDHLCRVRNCVNPAHLEAVTHAENMRRSGLARPRCPKGHDRLTDPYVSPSGKRACPDCLREHNRTYVRQPTSPNAPYACQECGRRFNTFLGIRTHIGKTHIRRPLGAEDTDQWSTR